MSKLEDSIRHRVYERSQVVSFMSTICEDIEFVPQGAQAVEYEVGDIIHTNKFYSPTSKSFIDSRGHYVLVIVSKNLNNGIIEYKGFVISSKIAKSNKYSRFSNNIYVEDDNTMYKSRNKVKHDEVFVRVDDLVTIYNKDLSTSGVFKGKASEEFQRFIDKCYQNYKQGKDNSNMYWEKEVSHS